MTRDRRRELIERYLNGRMTPDEEHDFFIQVATDDELRRMLRASRIVESALRKDRDATRIDEEQGRRRAMALIGGEASGRGAGGSSSGLPSGGTASGSSGVNGIMVTIIGIGMAALAAGTFFLGTLVHRQESAAPPEISRQLDSQVVAPALPSPTGTEKSEMAESPTAPSEPLPLRRAEVIAAPTAASRPRSEEASGIRPIDSMRTAQFPRNDTAHTRRTPDTAAAPSLPTVDLDDSTTFHGIIEWPEKK